MVLRVSNAWHGQPFLEPCRILTGLFGDSVRTGSNAVSFVHGVMATKLMDRLESRMCWTINQ